MERTKQDHKEQQQEEDILHCPKCMKRRKHGRRVSCGMEIFTCWSCGNVQSYLLGEEEQDEK